MPGDSGVTWLTSVRSTTLIAHAAIGRIGRPAFPAPSDWGGSFLAQPGRIAPRECEGVSEIASTPSSLRKQGPITTGLGGCVKVVDASAEALAKAEQRLSQQATLGMGPRFREDDD